MSHFNATSQIPRQRLPRREKDDEWKKKNVDSIYDISYFSDAADDQYRLVRKAYDLYNGIIDDEDYTHVLKPYGKKRENFPAKLHNYPIVKPIIDLLLGEKRNRPLNYSVTVENSDVNTKKSKKKKEQIKQALEDKLIEEIERNGVDPGEAKRQMQKGIEEIEKEFDENYRDERAIQGQKALNVIEREQEIKRNFNEGWFHFLISGEVYTERDIAGNQIEYDVLNPLHVDHDKSPETTFVEDGDWAAVRKFVHPSDVVDEYYDVLTPAEIDQIEDPEARSTTDYLLWSSATTESEEHQARLIELFKCYWKSRKKIGIVEYRDQFGQIREKQVEEDYEMQPNDIAVDWYWVNEVWQGTRIDEDIYVDIGPAPVQRRDMDNPSQCKLPINGRKYSDTNAPNVSLMILAYPYQLLYNIYKFRLENAIAKSKDIIAQLDINMIPSDWDMDKFMYYVDATGIAWMDYTKEGVEPNPHQQQVMDMSVKTIEQYISLLEYIKQELKDLIGINRQRQGNVGEHEGKGTTEYALQQSSSMTEDLFAKYAEFEERDLRGLLDLSKWTWINGKSTSYTTSDRAEEIAQIDGIQHMETEYGVYVSDAREEVVKLNKIEELGQAMLQNGTPASTVADIIDADSFAEMREKIEDAEEERMKLAQAQKKAERAQKKAERELEQQKIEADILQTKLDNRTDIKQEMIKQDGNLEELKEQKEIDREKLRLEKEQMRSDERIAEKQQESSSD